MPISFIKYCHHACRKSVKVPNKMLSNRNKCLQGGSFAYLTPTAAITMAIKASRDWDDAPDGTNHERFLVRDTLSEVLPKSDPKLVQDSPVLVHLAP